MAWQRITRPLAARAKHHGLYNELIAAQLCGVAQQHLPEGAKAVSLREGVLKIETTTTAQLQTMVVEKAMIAAVNTRAAVLGVSGVERVRRVVI